MHFFFFPAMSASLRRLLDALVIILPPLVIAAVASATKSFWGDEIMTIQFSAQTGASFLATLAADYHPPLYFLLVKGWMLLADDGEVGLRMLQALQGMLLIGVTLALWRKLLPAARWHAFFLLFVIAPELWLFLPMLRYYTLAATLATALTLVHVRWLEQPTRALDVWRVVLSLALLFTDYPTSIVIALHLVHTAFVRRDLLLRHLATTGITAVAFLPWVLVLLEQLAALHGVERVADLGGGFGAIPLKMLWALYAFVAGETSMPIDPWVIATLLALAPVLVIPRLRGRLFTTPGSGLLLLLVLGGVTFTALLTTFISRHTSFIYTPSRTLHALPVLFLLLGMWWEHVPVTWLRRAIVVVLAVCALPSLWNWQANTTFMMPVYASPWKQIVADTRGGHVLSDEADCYAWYAARTPGASVLINDWDSTRVEALLADTTARIFSVMTERESTGPMFEMDLFFRIISVTEPLGRRVYVPYDSRWNMVRTTLLRRNAGEGKFIVHTLRPISRQHLDSLVGCRDGAPF